jgi:hypothetical protein
MHQSGPRREGSASRHSQGAAHPTGPADDHDPSSVSLVVHGTQSTLPVDRLEISDGGRPARVRWWVADVHYHDRPHFVSGQQMASAETSEGDRQVGPGGTMYDATQEIDAGGSVNCDKRDFQVENTG